MKSCAAICARKPVISCITRPGLPVPDETAVNETLKILGRTQEELQSTAVRFESVYQLSGVQIWNGPSCLLRLGDFASLQHLIQATKILGVVESDKFLRT